MARQEIMDHLTKGLLMTGGSEQDDDFGKWFCQREDYQELTSRVDRLSNCNICGCRPPCDKISFGQGYGGYQSFFLCEKCQAELKRVLKGD